MKKVNDLAKLSEIVDTEALSPVVTLTTMRGFFKPTCSIWEDIDEYLIRLNYSDISKLKNVDFVLKAVNNDFINESNKVAYLRNLQAHYSNLFYSFKRKIKYVDLEGQRDRYKELDWLCECEELEKYDGWEFKKCAYAMYKGKECIYTYHYCCSDCGHEPLEVMYDIAHTFKVLDICASLLKVKELLGNLASDILDGRYKEFKAKHPKGRVVPTSNKKDLAKFRRSIGFHYNNLPMEYKNKVNLSHAMNEKAWINLGRNFTESYKIEDVIRTLYDINIRF